jgi:PilZ domain
MLCGSYRASIRRYLEHRVMSANSAGVCFRGGGAPVKMSATIEQPGESPAQELAERRKTQRFACEGTGDVIVLGGALHFAGELRDLSISGCRLKMQAPFTLERGTRVEVLMEVNRVRFRVAAGVRATNRTQGLGLEFMDLSTRCIRLIQELIVELKAGAERERLA